MSDDYASSQLEGVRQRVQGIKDRSRKEMFEDVPDGMIGVISQSQEARTVSVCDDILEALPEPEPMEVRRYRALVLAMDTVRTSADLDGFYGDPTAALQRVVIRFRETARNLIENRIELHAPTDEDDADVVYLVDPVSRTHRTIALGGYREEYDRAMVDGAIDEMAEAILNEPLPDTMPRL